MKKLLTLLLLFFITLYTFPHVIAGKDDVEKALLEKDVEGKSKQKEKSENDEKEFFVAHQSFNHPLNIISSNFLQYTTVFLTTHAPDVATPPPDSRS